MDLKMPDTSRIKLNLEIAFSHYGLQLPATLLMVAICLLVWIFWVPVQFAAANRATSQLQRAELELSRSRNAVPQKPPLQAFREQLLPQDQTTAQLRLVFQLATNAGINVTQVDMRRQMNTAGVYSQLQIVLPVKGSYLNIKRFCSDLLQGMAASSIDQLILKHEPGAGEAEAQITMSIWQEAIPKEAQ